MKFGHETKRKGTKTSPRVINHLLNGMILQVRVVFQRILEDMVVCRFSLGVFLGDPLFQSSFFLQKGINKKSMRFTFKRRRLKSMVTFE